jgi:hypothetical protein
LTLITTANVSIAPSRQFGVHIPGGAKDITFLHKLQTDSGALPVFLIQRYLPYFRRYSGLSVKPPLSSTKVRNGWSYTSTSTPPTCLHDVDRNNFTFPRIYKACSKKTNFCYKDYCSFYSIVSTVPFKVVPSTGDTPFLTLIPLLECFLERTSVMARSSVIEFS